MVIPCQNLTFDTKLSMQRINRAISIFGSAVIRRIFCFSLYLLGIKRTSIAKSLEMPPESVKTIIKNIQRNGIPAFEDRRFRNSAFLPQTQRVLPFKVAFDGEWVNIDLGTLEKRLRIPRNNTLQFRTLLLTMVNSGILSTREASKHLELSDVQTRTLAKKLHEKDIHGLVDQRQGQKRDYVFNLDIKAEMMQQYIANLVNNKKTSSQALSKDLKERCDLDLSSRTIRFHIEKTGLLKIKKSLPGLIERLKKTQKTNR